MKQDILKKKVSKKAKAFGKLLRQARESQNWSAELMAVRMGVTRQQIHNYEEGITSVALSKLSDLCSKYKVDVTEALRKVGYID